MPENQISQPPRPTNQGKFQDYVARATTNVRQYQQQVARGQYVPLYARFKLKFYYIDGNSSVHYSYDSFHQYQDGVKNRITDESIGFSKLLRCVKSNEGKYVTAVIWAVMQDDTSTSQGKYNFQIAKFVRNRTPNVYKHFNIDTAFVNGKLDWRTLLKKFHE